jgi:hypothetical protein
MQAVTSSCAFRGDEKESENPKQPSTEAMPIDRRSEEEIGDVRVWLASKHGPFSFNSFYDCTSRAERRTPSKEVESRKGCMCVMVPMAGCSRTETKVLNKS